MPMNKSYSSGQIMILSIIFLVVVMTLVSALLSYVFLNVRATRIAVAKEQALQLAEAAIDKAVWQLNQTAGGYTGETGTILGAGVFDTSISNLSSSLREITATGYIPNKAAPQVTKQIKVRVSIDTTNVSFNYGVQVGQGGLVMSNNSLINGSVYSDGTIDGAAGAHITGDAYSSGATGRIFDRVQIDGNAHANQIDTNVAVGANAYGYAMDNVTVGASAFMYSVSNCTVGGNASYTTKTSCTISGSQNTPYPGEPNPQSIPLPISNQEITDWENQATSGGTIIGDYALSNFAQATIGPKKITGNLTLSNGAELTLTGPIWVNGKISVSNNAIITLSPSYGNGSEVIVADGIIDVSNDAIFQKAGPSSYIMMLTTSFSGSAFSIANNADALIAYAANGTVAVANNAQLREVTGWQISLSNNSIITYETGLASVNFTGGPGGSWKIERGTWREIN
jgi:Tfp pilus assembly protein PilX